MTATSGLIGGLLAVGAARLTGEVTRQLAAASLLAVVGLVVAHAANNMINDYFDLEGGVDTDDYVRALYAPHPILSGWVTKRQLGAAILLANAIDLAIMLSLHGRAARSSSRSPWPGLFISVFYVAPPIRLKHLGLGEPGVFLVWGPLMVVGTFFVATGAIPAGRGSPRCPTRSSSRPSCSGSTSTRSRPTRRRASGRCRSSSASGAPALVAQVLMIAFYPIVVGAALVGWIGPWVALVLLGLPRLLEVARDVLDAAAGDAAAQLRRLAAVVRRRRLRPHPARRRPAGPRPAPERAAADHAALGLSRGAAGRPHHRSCTDGRSRRRHASSIRALLPRWHAAVQPSAMLLWTQRAARMTRPSRREPAMRWPIQCLSTRSTRARATARHVREADRRAMYARPGRPATPRRRRRGSSDGCTPARAGAASSGVAARCRGRSGQQPANPS